MTFTWQRFISGSMIAEETQNRNANRVQGGGSLIGILEAASTHSPTTRRRWRRRRNASKNARAQGTPLDVVSTTSSSSFTCAKRRRNADFYVLSAPVDDVSASSSFSPVQRWQSIATSYSFRYYWVIVKVRLDQADDFILIKFIFQ